MGFLSVKREPNFANDFRSLAPWHEACDGTAMSTPAPGSIDMLKRLVAFDTTSRNSNLELIRCIRDYLDGHGVAGTLVPSAEGTKANLFASIGPETEGGVVLSGHTDVVPVDGQAWATDPWELTEKADGNLYGRGTCDMKGFIAACLAHVPALQRARLKVPMHFAFSYDEEIGCLGAHSLAEQLVVAVPRPQAVIVGEPTVMGVVDAQNAGGGIVATFTGVEAHSSMTHLGVSAIHFAGDFSWRRASAPTSTPCPATPRSMSAS